MVTLAKVNSFFRDNHIDSLVNNFFNHSLSDIDCGYAKYGTIDYCQFIKYASKSFIQEGGVILSKNSNIVINGSIRDSNLSITKIFTEDSLLTEIVFGKNLTHYKFIVEINDRVVCEFYGNGKIVAFHEGDWIDIFRNELAFIKNEKSKNDHDNISKYFDSQLDSDSFSLGGEEQTIADLKPIKSIEQNRKKLIRPPKERTLSLHEFKKGKINIHNINKFKNGQRSKVLIHCLLELFTKKHVEIAGAGSSYVFIYKHGSKVVNLSKQDSCKYIENKIKKYDL